MTRSYLLSIQVKCQKGTGANIPYGDSKNKTVFVLSIFIDWFVSNELAHVQERDVAP